MRCYLLAYNECQKKFKRERERDVFATWCNDIEGYEFRTKKSIQDMLCNIYSREYVTNALYVLKKAGLIKEINGFLVEGDLFIRINNFYKDNHSTGQFYCERILREDEIPEDAITEDEVPKITKKQTKELTIQEKAKEVEKNLRIIGNWTCNDAANSILEYIDEDTDDSEIESIVNIAVHNKSKPDAYWKALKHKDGSKKSKQEFKDDIYQVVRSRISQSMATKAALSRDNKVIKEYHVSDILNIEQTIDINAEQEVENLMREGLNEKRTL